MSQNRDRVARIVQQRRSRQVNRLKGRELTGQGTAQRAELPPGVVGDHSRDELIDHTDVEVIAMRCPRHFHLEKAGGGQPLLHAGIHDEPRSLIGSGLAEECEQRH